MWTPNDKVTKCLMHRPPDKFAGMLQQGKPAAVDEKITVKREKIYSHYWLEQVEGDLDLTPFDEFDRLVLDACISAQNNGDVGITKNEIARIISGGKSIKQMPKPPAELIERITLSLNRLMCRRIRIDFSQLAATGKYPKLDASGRLTDMVLPCALLENVEVNGQRHVDFVYFRGTSPLLSLARAKNQQLLSYPIDLLDVPNLKNNARIAVIKSYVVRRVLEIKAHKNLTPKITFDDVFDNCGLVNAAKQTKMNARNVILKVLNHLKTKEIIRDFEIEKNGKSYHAVKVVR